MRARLGHSQWERRVDSVPFTRPLNYSPVVHARGGVAQDGSWRFFDRGGDGGDAGRVLRDADRTVGDFGIIIQRHRNAAGRWRRDRGFEIVVSAW